ncbi:MAG: hypothetical protein QM597_04240 [Aeromicrobium sp.]|uniref:DUF6801 domain-containing protein n=1 Tax=Aeromicrobium sp. TaxID=1871063 RepID=UPI0039E6EE63
MAVLAPASAAQAAERHRVTSQLTYTCRIAGVADPATVGVMFTLDAPTSVSPGEALSISGSVTLRLPENVRAAATYANITAVEGYSETMTVPVTINGQTSVVRTAPLVAPRVSIGNPLTVQASLSVNTFTVPANAQGQIVVAGPRNGTVSSPRQDLEPKMVAFTAMTTAYSDTGTQTIGLYCYNTGGADGTLLTIPVTSTSTGESSAETPTAPTTEPPAVAPAASGEAESAAKDNASTFRAASQPTSESSHTARNLGLLVGVMAVLAIFWGVLAQRRIAALRRMTADR